MKGNEKRESPFFKNKKMVYFSQSFFCGGSDGSFLAGWLSCVCNMLCM